MVEYARQNFCYDKWSRVCGLPKQNILLFKRNTEAFAEWAGKQNEKQQIIQFFVQK